MEPFVQIFSHRLNKIQNRLIGFLSFLLFTTVFISCTDNTSATSNNSSDSATNYQMDTSSAANTKPGSALKPQGPKPAWGADITDPMAVVIEKLASYNAPPLVSLSAKESRIQPSPADAATAVMQEHNIPDAPNNVDTMGKMIPVGNAQIPV